MKAATFQRILAIHIDSGLDRSLLNYAASLAALDGSAKTLVAALPTDIVLRKLRQFVREAFWAHGVAKPSLHLLNEPELDGILDLANHWSADLIVSPHPRVLSKGRGVARRLLYEAPCSVCFVPPNAVPRIERAVAEIEISDSGRELFRRIAGFCRRARATELIALRTLEGRTLAPNGTEESPAQREALLELYRMIPRAQFGETICTPVIEEDPVPERAILRVIRRQRIQLVMVGRAGQAPFPLSAPSRKIENLLWKCPAPLLQVLLPGGGMSLGRALRAIFSGSEPAFN
jgi:hypothetical protein